MYSTDITTVWGKRSGRSKPGYMSARKKGTNRNIPISDSTFMHGKEIEIIS